METDGSTTSCLKTAGGVAARSVEHRHVNMQVRIMVRLQVLGAGKGQNDPVSCSQVHWPALLAAQLPVMASSCNDPNRTEPPLTIQITMIRDACTARKELKPQASQRKGSRVRT